MRDGDPVRWRRGGAAATGTVRTVRAEGTTRGLDGRGIGRDGTKEEPALYIEREDGDGVLPLASKVERA